MVANAMVINQEDINVMQWKAKTLIDSGLLPQHIKNANQVIAIDMMARELNIPTWQAINGINVIQGKPTVSPQLMLALIERSGKLEDIKIDTKADSCTVTMKRRGRSAHTETFTMKDAQAMQLSNKDNYRKQPSVMLKWRAISACARVVFPDVLMGMYTTEEIAPDTVRVDAEGDFEIIEAPPSNVVQFEKERKILGSGEGERRIPQQTPPQIIVTEGSSALQPQPEIEQPETADSPNGAQPTPPVSDMSDTADPKPSENAKDDIGKWQFFQQLMGDIAIKKLYPEGPHRKNVLAKLKAAGAFESNKPTSMVWRIQMYHQLRAEGHSEEEAASAAATAPDELEGF